jgi:hypothetical protein
MTGIVAGDTSPSSQSCSSARHSQAVSILLKRIRAGPCLAFCASSAQFAAFSRYLSDSFAWAPLPADAVEDKGPSKKTHRIKRLNAGQPGNVSETNGDCLAPSGGYCVIYFQQGLVGTSSAFNKSFKATGQQEFDPLKPRKSANT